MKSLSLILCAALLAVSAGGQAEPRGRSLDIPAPPAPPMPPMPPTLLAPPPPPPPPPAPPTVPERAHAACVGKQIGTAMTFSPAKGVIMRGSCQSDSKGMYFELQSSSSQS